MHFHVTELTGAVFHQHVQQLSWVSLGRCEEARNREKFDVCWRSWRGWSKSPFTTNLCFFGRFLLINISLIPKLDASIRGLMSIDTQNSRKQICPPQRGTQSASCGCLHTARLGTLQHIPGFLGWKENSGCLSNKSMGVIAKSWVSWCEMQGGEESTAASKSQTWKRITWSGDCSTRAQHPAVDRCSNPFFLFWKQRSSSQLSTRETTLRKILN